jgi:hypothetical protein
VNRWLMLEIKEYCLQSILDSGSSFSIRRDVFQRILSLGLSRSAETTNREIHMTSGQSCVIISRIVAGKHPVI